MARMWLVDGDNLIESHIRSQENVDEVKKQLPEHEYWNYIHLSKDFFDNRIDLTDYFPVEILEELESKIEEGYDGDIREYISKKYGEEYDRFIYYIFGILDVKKFEGRSLSKLKKIRDDLQELGLSTKECDRYLSEVEIGKKNQRVFSLVMRLREE